MNLFGEAKFNGQFLRPNSAKPIAGTICATAYNRSLSEVQVGSEGLVQGQGVKVQNGGTANVNAGLGLAPGVLAANALTASDKIGGFLVESANAVINEGSEAPIFFAKQLVRAALIGSGAELYLACDNTLINSTNPIYYDFANNQLTSAASAPANSVLVDNITITSQVVDGVKAVYDASSGVATFEDTAVVRVKL